MTTFMKGIGQFGLACIGILLILASPALISGPKSFAASTMTIMQEIMHPGTLSYYAHSETLSFSRMPEARSVEFHQKQATIELFPSILDSYVYSMSLMMGGLMLSIVVASLSGLFLIQFPSFLKKVIFSAIDVLESVPDVFFIFSIQLCVVWFYKMTGVELALAYSTNDQQAFLLPVIILSIVPGIYMLKIQLLFMNEEMEKDYALFAKSKGLSHAMISLHHIFRNTVMECLAHLPVIVLSLFTHLVVLEFLFQSNGIMRFILGDQPASSRVFMLILTMTPFFIIINGLNHFRQRFYPGSGGEME
ncbi:ABC transporter permease subunit [Rossellomorea vietnamensis]|uniref:ABC transporter permease subunit n=1 Tax=Rossellomorea vietnamensis TaxID=218284 RepID=UPI0030869BE4|nr:ABC transporter permease subunit [Rossellomorea vietnamensis]